MPKQRRSRFTRRKANALPAGRPAARQPCCFVCYSEYTPYPLTCNSWEASMGKVFYKVLNLPTSQINGDMDMEEGESNEEEEDYTSIPFCPQCHSKVSVMFSLYTQLQFVQEQFCSVRNDVAFTVVETISKNCRNGPMDSFRQQICQQWQAAYNEAKARDEMGLGQEPASVYFGDSKNSSNKTVPTGQIKIKTELATENIEMKKSPGIISQVLPTKPALSPGIAHVRRDESEVLNETIKKRSQSPIPAMPKLIPMAKLQAEAQRNLSRQSLTNRLPNPFLLKTPVNKLKLIDPRSVSPDINPPSPTTAGRKRLGNGTVLQENRGSAKGRPPGSIRPQVSVQIKTDLKKTDNKRIIRRKRNSSSDESCEAGLTTKDIILKQNSLAMSDGEGELQQCKLCPRQYSTLSRLNRHESLCHPMLKAQRCHLCPKGFSSALTLRRHMQNIHHSKIEGYTMCPLCDRSFIKKYAFEVHLKGHAQQGLIVPRLSPSEMPPPPSGGKSASNSRNRKNTAKRTGPLKITGKPGNQSNKGYTYQPASRLKSSRTGRTVKLSARAKAASKSISQHVPTSKTNIPGKPLVSNTVLKTASKLNHKVVPKVSVAVVSSKNRSPATVAVKKKTALASYSASKMGPASKRFKASAIDDEEEDEIDDDEDSDDPGVGIDDSDSDYDP